MTAYRADIVFDHAYNYQPNGHVILEHIPEINALHLQWFGSISFEDHMRSAEGAIEYIRSRSVANWIGDPFEITAPLGDDTAAWIAEPWARLACEAGIERIAIVMPKHAYLHDSIREFPLPDELSEIMRQAGFKSVSYKRLTNGIAAIHIAAK